MSDYQVGVLGTGGLSYHAKRGDSTRMLCEKDVGTSWRARPGFGVTCIACRTALGLPAAWFLGEIDGDPDTHAVPGREALALCGKRVHFPKGGDGAPTCPVCLAAVAQDTP